MPSGFKKFVGYSVLAHFFFVIFLVDVPKWSRFFPERKTKVTWIRLTKGTGEKPSPNPFKKAKGMPQSTLREQKMALQEKFKDKKGADLKSIPSPVQKKDNEEPTQQKTAPDPGINFKTPKTNRDRTIEDALARVEQQLEQRQVEIEVAQIENEGTGQSPQGSLDVKNGETNPALITYYEAIKGKINKEWITTPKQLAEGQMLQTKINLNVDASGNLVSADYDTKSADPSFDLSAMRAVERAAPFPPPPDEIKNEVIREGFLIEFNPRTVVGSRP